MFQNLVSKKIMMSWHGKSVEQATVCCISYYIRDVKLRDFDLIAKLNRQ